MFDYEVAARRVALADRARDAVKSRAYTDKPGGRWFVSSHGHPTFYGSRHVFISTNDDGTAYKVIACDRAGSAEDSAERKTLDAAFRCGEKLAG